MAFLLESYEIRPDGLLSVTELTAAEELGLYEFDTSAALRAFLRDYLDNQELYGETTTWARVSDGGGNS